MDIFFVLNDWPSSGYLGHGLITTGGHIGGAGSGRYKVNNPGGVTLKFKIHAGETYALKLHLPLLQQLQVIIIVIGHIPM